MRIGIIGSGNIGGATAKLFAAAGHQVALSHAGSPEMLRDQVAALGRLARAVTVEQAIDFGEVVLLALPWRSRGELPAERLRGKVVIDATNPYRPDHRLEDLGPSTSSEEMARTLRGARLVKGFNTLLAEDLASRGDLSLRPEERTALFLAGDDQQAKELVAELADEIGFAPIDAGSLRQGGRLQQAGGPLHGRVLTAADAWLVMRRGEEAAQGRATAEPQHP